jgi:chromosome segregation ATPase
MEQLVHEQENLRSIREKYGEIQALLGPGVDEIQDGIAELHHYHDLQHVIDVDAAKERTKLEQELTAIAERIHREEERYVAIEREIAAEQESLKSQSKEVDMLSEEERTLLTRIHAMQDTVKDVLVRMSSESKSIEMHRERLSSLQSLSKSLEQDISQRKKKEIAALEQVSKDQSARIKRLQEELLAKARARLTTAKEPAQVEARLKEFFEKREATAAALRTIEHDYQLAQDQLAALAVKARTLSVAGVDAQEHSKEITHQFDQLSKERENLAGEMQLLGKLVLGEVKATDAMT